MDAADLGVRLAGWKREDVGENLAFLGLAHADLVGSETSLGENRAALLGSGPDRGTFLPSIVSSPENDVNGTRQRVSGLRQRPRCALPHADLGSAGIGLDPQQLLEVDWPALCF